MTQNQKKPEARGDLEGHGETSSHGRGPGTVDVSDDQVLDQTQLGSCQTVRTLHPDPARTQFEDVERSVPNRIDSPALVGTDGWTWQVDGAIPKGDGPIFTDAVHGVHGERINGEIVLKGRNQN